jgi:hypothetical protein
LGDAAERRREFNTNDALERKRKRGQEDSSLSATDIHERKILGA